jgi:hypothetical protein
MLIKEKVIFDTNSLFNRKATSFLGNNADFSKFANVTDIIIPGIVLDELEAKYKRQFEDEKEKYLKTLLPSIMQSDIKKVDFDVRLEELKKSETINYEVIELTDFSVLSKMRELAVNKLPPFEPGDNTDKGFKDAYIYFTILEYIQTIPDNKVFVCVKDTRFKEALKQNPRIIPIESFKEFMKYRISQYTSDYFISKLNQELGLSVVKTDVLDCWTNVDENTCLLIQLEEDQYVIQVDSGEIIDYKNKNEYRDSIESFVNSDSYRTTRIMVGKLKECVNFLSDDEISQLLEAVIDNSQIRHIVKDDINRQFVGDMLEKKKSILDMNVERELTSLIS